MTDRAARPLDYAALSENERAAVETLYYGERQIYERCDLLCSARELKRLVRLGWIESTPEQVDVPHYDRGASYHPAAYWITGAGCDAMQQAEQQARIDFWLKQERTAKILCFPLRVDYPARKERAL
jgi:hypothetical protein